MFRNELFSSETQNILQNIIQLAEKGRIVFCSNISLMYQYFLAKNIFVIGKFPFYLFYICEKCVWVVPGKIYILSTMKPVLLLTIVSTLGQVCETSGLLSDFKVG